MSYSEDFEFQKYFADPEKWHGGGMCIFYKRVGFKTWKVRIPLKTINSP